MPPNSRVNNRFSYGNIYSGFGQMGVTTSQCYKCKKRGIGVSEVRPPDRRHGRKSNKTHSCEAPDCHSQPSFTGGPDSYYHYVNHGVTYPGARPKTRDPYMAAPDQPVKGIQLYDLRKNSDYLCGIEVQLSLLIFITVLHI